MRRGGGPPPPLTEGLAAFDGVRRRFDELREDLADRYLIERELEHGRDGGVRLLLARDLHHERLVGVADVGRVTLLLAVDCDGGDAEFAAGPGITVLFGRSGAGKSTVVNALVGLLRPMRLPPEAPSRAALYETDSARTSYG